MPSLRPVALGSLLALTACPVWPGDPVVSLSPEAPSTLDDLILEADTAAEDDEDVALEIVWYVDGVEAEGLAGATTVPASETRKGELWEAVVLAVDPKQRVSSPRRVSTVIENTPPTAQITCPSETPTSEEDVSLTVTGEDVDEDQVSWTVTWSRDGEPAVEFGETLGSDSTTFGETWTATVTPTDGEDEGESVACVVEIGNASPVGDSLVIAPADGSPMADVRVGTELIAIAEGEDPDEDGLYWEIAWYVNGSDTGSRGATFSVPFAKGDVVTAVGTPRDRQDPGDAEVRVGTPIESDNEVLVGNTPPTVDAVSVQPGALYADSEVSCVASGLADVDGDEVTGRVEWMVNGSVVAGTTLARGAFAKGDVIRCMVTPFDGDDDGEPISSPGPGVEVLDSAPTCTGVILGPSTPTERDTVSAESSCADADDDAITLAHAWTVDGSLLTAVTGPRLRSTHFDKGDTIAVTITPTAAGVSGTSATSATLTAGNTAPNLFRTGFVTTDVRTDDTLVADVVDGDLDRADTLTRTFTWTVTPAGGGSPTVVSGVTGASVDGTLHFSRGDTVSYRVAVSDGTDTTTGSSSGVTVKNTAPRVATATISPGTLREGDTARCVPGGWVDPDGDTEDYGYAWSVDGTLVSGETTSTLTSAHFSKGQDVTCTLTPDDGIETGSPVTSAPVEIANTAPSFTTLAVSPASPREADTVRASASGWSDADGDPEGYRYVWAVQSGGSGSFVVVSGATSSTLTGRDFDKDDVIRATVTPYDGEDEGTPRVATVTVVNTVPTTPTCSLSPSSPGTNDALTVSASGSTDADGDTLTYSYSWDVGGSGVSGASGSTLLASAYAKGDPVTAKVVALDGDGSSPACSSSVTIGDTRPNPPKVVTLSPAEPTPDDTLTCAWSGASDPDGDSLAYSVDWVKDGSTSSTVSSTTAASVTLSSSNTSDGDEWSCEVTTLADGAESGSKASTTVTVEADLYPAFARGSSHTCILRPDKAIWCWGYNASGQLGLGDTTYRSSPAKVGSKTWKHLDAGHSHTCAVDTSDDLWCWGRNANGQLGDGTTTRRTTPVRVSGSRKWKAITAHEDQTCAITTSGALFCWGKGATNRLGNGSTANRTTPTAVSGGGTYKAVGAGKGHTCGVRTDGSLWCWGNNNNGQLGDGTLTSRATPVRESTRRTDWVSVQGGEQNGVTHSEAHTCALTTGGALYCWGLNNLGQLGVGDKTRRTSPTREASRSTWSEFSLQSDYTCGIKSDGSFWCWGRGNFYNLANRATLDQTRPVREHSSASDWTAVGTPGVTTCGVRDDKDVYCVGADGWGAVGNGEPRATESTWQKIMSF